MKTKDMELNVLLHRMDTASMEFVRSVVIEADSCDCSNCTIAGNHGRMLLQWEMYRSHLIPENWVGRHFICEN